MVARLVSALLAATALAPAAVGCGGSDETSTTSSAATTSSPEVTVAGADEPVTVLGATVTSTTAGKPGAVVVSVQSPTTKLHEGDVIVEAGGKPVEDAGDLRDAAGSLGLGEGVTLKVIRGSKTFGLNIVQAATTYLGVNVKDAKGGGAQVLAVQPDSPAERAGLRKGDLIIEAAGEPVDRKQLPAIVGSHEPGEEIELTVERGSKELTLTATLAENPATQG